MEKQIGVGVGVFIRREGKVLLGCRISEHGGGTWCTPGGHMEFGESPEEAGAREVYEETGLRVKNIRFVTITNDFFKESGKHYITLCLVADYDGGEARVTEPDKFAKWEWFPWQKDEVPQPLFLPQNELMNKGFDPFKI